MLSFFSEYLFPTNLIALGILTFLTTFFLYWVIEVIRYWRWLRTERKQIENKQNVQPLVTARQERDRGRDDNDQKTNPENTFSKFCTEGSLDRGSPIAKHLNAIFLAGWDESRLEVGELINHTTSELFKRNSLFRSVLAVFIVIGLFGTLFGLADSLTGLFPALKANVASETPAENSEGMIQALGILLEGMKGALAPSICGIFFTILGVILYGAYLQFACHPIKAVLERLTLTVWVPQLYPTTSQNLIQTLQKSEEQMRSGYQTAAQVHELVENVQGNISEFNENLKRANAITEPLSDSSTQINKAALDISTAANTLNTGFTESLGKFSQEFTANVTRLTGFQDEIRSLHKEFQNAANEKLDAQDQKLDEQTQHLVKVLDALKSYEDAYIKSREQIDETLQKFINKATEANTSIHERNREWFEKINSDNRKEFSEIRGQLKTDLTEFQQTLEKELKTLSNTLAGNLKNVQKSLDERLGVLNERLENFDTPLKETVEEIKGVFDERLTTLNEQLEKLPEPIQESADQMRGTFADLVTFMRGIVGNLQQEIREQNEKYEAQLTGVKSLNESVKNLLTQLDESSRNQSTAISTLNSKVENLTGNTHDLAAAITSFTSDSGAISQSIATIERHTETLGTASQQFVENVERADVTPLNVNIERLNTIIGDISQNSQTLAITVSQLKTQINSSGTTESGRHRNRRSLLNRLNPFSRKKTDGR